MRRSGAGAESRGIRKVEQADSIICAAFLDFLDAFIRGEGFQFRVAGSQFQTETIHEAAETLAVGCKCR